MEDFKQMIREMDKKEFFTDLICMGLFTIGIFKILPYIVILLGE